MLDKRIQNRDHLQRNNTDENKTYEKYNPNLGVERVMRRQNSLTIFGSFLFSSSNANKQNKESNNQQCNNNDQQNKPKL